MNILLCSWQSVSEKGLIYSLDKICENLYIFDKSWTSIDYDTDYITKLSEYISNHKGIDYCMTINYIPIIARVCSIFHIPYISWTYDSPSLSLYSNTLSLDTNYVFVIDRALATRFGSRNPGHIIALPIACATESCRPLAISDEEHRRFDCDISFIGSLYTEKCSFRYDEVAKKIPEYMRGYMDGLIQAQLNVYGYNFLADTLDDSTANEYFSYTGLELPPDYDINIREIVADFYLGYKCSALERIKTLISIGEHFPLSVYTNSDFSSLNDPKDIPNIKNCGTVGYNTDMPKVFACSKINLNITTKTNQTGIPSRIFDVMAAGGFVISNYQEEILEYFVPGEDIVIYDSIPDLLNKIEYYLSHDDERNTIAQNGYNKVKQLHTYDNRMKDLFEFMETLKS